MFTVYFLHNTVICYNTRTHDFTTQILLHIAILVFISIKEDNNPTVLHTSSNSEAVLKTKQTFLCAYIQISPKETKIG